MDPMVTKGATPQDYSASVSDTVSLVGKEPMMGGPSPGGFMPHTTGVGQCGNIATYTWGCHGNWLGIGQHCYQ